MAETLNEHDAAPGTRKVSLLVRVLEYDDLLAELPPAFFVLDGRPRVELGRGECSGPRWSGGKIEFSDPFVSTEHAVIEPGGGRLRLVDRGSRNGTFVDGVQRTAHELTDGCLIEIGHTLLCFRHVEARLVELLDSGQVPSELGPTRTRSPELIETVRRLRALAATPDPVLLLGETGVGKEIAAHAIHLWSGRTGPLRAVDCGAVPEGLFESTLFGHRRGAFTGAHEKRSGELVLAGGGTLFLDEVGNMGEASQAKLLRCLESGTVQALGASESEMLDFRLVSATNRDLLRDPQGFRPDLINRLSGFVVRLPPLRGRREDLGVLTRHFLAEAGARKASIRPAAARSLFPSRFSGNLRQLRGALRSALVLAAGAPFELDHLPALDVSAGEAEVGPETRAETRPEAERAAPEREEILRALEVEAGNVAGAARRLSVNVRRLYRWMERLQIDPRQFREKAS